MTGKMVCNILCETLSFIHISIIVLAGSIWWRRRKEPKSMIAKMVCNIFCETLSIFLHFHYCSNLKHLEEDEEQPEPESMTAKMV